MTGNATDTGPPPAASDGGLEGVAPSAEPRLWQRAGLVPEATRAVLVFAGLIGVLLVLPFLGPIVTALLPVPMALLAVRRGRSVLLGGAVGLTTAAALVLTDWDVRQFLALAVLLVGLGALIPAVLATCAMGRRLQTGGYGWVAVSFLAVLGASLALLWGGSVERTVRTALVEVIHQVQDPQIDRCEKTDSDSERCATMVEQQAVALRLARDHTLAVVSLLLTIGCITIAVVSLRAFRWFGVRAGLPVHRSHAFRDFRPHWSLPYVLAVGLLWLMAATHLGDVDDPAAIVGLCIAVAATGVLVAQGAAVLTWYMDRWGVRRFMRVITWVLIVLVSWSLGFLLALALVDSWRNLRSSGDGSPRSERPGGRT